MSHNMDRRHFVSLTLALAPFAALPGLSAVGNAAETAHLDLMFSILAPAFRLSERHRALMPAFLGRLKTPGLHSLSPQRVAAWLAQPEAHYADLAAYLGEEFLIGSNYFAVTDGHEVDYRILPVVG